MSAHNKATLDAGIERVQSVIDRLADIRATGGSDAGWGERLEACLAAPAGGTLRAWMQAHLGQDVHLLQANVYSGVVNEDLASAELSQYRRIRSLWAPGPRRVEEVRAGCVIQDGSRRDFAGVVTLRSSDTHYIGFAKWGDDAVQMLAYCVV